MIQQTLEETKKLVWPEIDKYLKDPAYPSQFGLPEKYKTEIDEFWKVNREYPERKGKYLRPTLVLLSAQALGLQIENAVRIAGAMQLSEDWILIHDDIEDSSVLRRNKPTLHKIYGQELAINAGDSLHMIMWKMIFDENNSKITEEFFKMLMRTAMGQGIEQIWTNQNKILDDDEYFFVADSKSAYYSIAGPIRLGAILANATDGQIEKLTNFGLYLGRCFQLVDDLIDLEQDKAEGKITLANTKGVPYTKKLAEDMKQKAKEIFDNDLGFLSHEPAKSKIVELMNFILERKY